MRWKTALVGGLAAVLFSIPSRAYAQKIIEHSFSNPTQFRIIEEVRKPALTEEDVFNSFFRPNAISKISYGDGDVNLDGVVDQEDYNLMKSGTKNEQADVNGDGNPGTNSDIKTLEDYLYNNIILPGQWNNLPDYLPKENWFDKTKIIDKTNKIPARPDNYEWNCHHYAVQTHFNFFGFEKFNEEDNNVPDKFSLDNNGRFNLPVYYVYILISSEEAHAINTILIGDDPLNFNDWYFVEPQNDEKVRPGDWSMPKNSQVYIESIFRFHGKPNQYDSFDSFLLLKFDIDDKGRGSLDYYDPNLVLTRPDRDIVSVENIPQFNDHLKQNYPNPFNNSSIIEYSISKPNNISLKLFNILGQELESLVDGYQKGGNYKFEFNGSSYGGGVYFYQLKTDDFVESKKMLLVK